jgi:lysozyme family protein
MTIDKNFNESLKIILFWEGGISDDKDDPGGKTKWGLSTRFLKSIGLNVEVITRDLMKDIYWQHFWAACRCEKMPHWLALPVFGCAVNQGVGRSTRILQKVLKVKVDGNIGPKTLAAIKNQVPSDILLDFMARRAMHYSSLLKLIKYRYGWFRRLFDVHRHAVNLLP